VATGTGPRRPHSGRGKTQKPATRDVADIVQGLRRITRAIELYSQDVQRSYGLTGPQLWALKNLQRAGPLTPNRLADSLAVDQSSVSGLLRRLEEKGLVHRARMAEDQRSVRIELTAEGRSLARRAPEAAQGRLLHGLSNMSPARVQALRRSIETLVGAMEASTIEARFFFSDD
jgi:DNA-binding MarR family transcriptional regulator